MRPAIHQRQAGAFLQRLDATAEGGLAEMHPLGGRRKASLFGKGDEMGEAAKVHGGLPCCVKRNIAPL